MSKIGWSVASSIFVLCCNINVVMTLYMAVVSCPCVFSASVSHKKLLLMRWEKAAIDKASLPLSPPPSPHTSQPHTITESGLTKDRDSPLFEELSDEEFEDARKPADAADEKGNVIFLKCSCSFFFHFCLET